MRYTVVVTAKAAHDLSAAREYIRQFAPVAADRWYCEFQDALLSLESNPESRSLAPESADLAIELRQFLFRTRSRIANRALFTIVGREVHVLAIRRPGQPLVTEDDLRDG